jgi:uncharacterized protein YndB with AHSA1/START domain
MSHTFDVSTPTERDIVMTRVFDAPRELLWACHTEPALVRRWLLGPPGWSMPVCDIDLRVGGGYRYLWRSDADGAEFGSRGDYREVDAPARIVHGERMDGVPAEAGEALCTLALTEADGRTTLTYTMRFDSTAVRDQALASGMAAGVGASYDRLEREVLASAVA